LKKTYPTIKDKTRRTGRGRDNLFDEIYFQDKTMNVPRIISSPAIGNFQLGK
jgi:hypothetical protein